MGLISLVCTPKMVHSLGKHAFDPFLTHFWSENRPFSRHFGTFHGPKSVMCLNAIVCITALGTLVVYIMMRRITSSLFPHSQLCSIPQWSGVRAQCTCLGRVMGSSEGPKVVGFFPYIVPRPLEVVKQVVQGYFEPSWTHMSPCKLKKNPWNGQFWD